MKPSFQEIKFVFASKADWFLMKSTLLTQNIKESVVLKVT